MSKVNIFHEGNWYKANLHCHSTESDGQLTPAEIKELYKLNGYNIVAYTDHNVVNYFKELNDPDFIALCGVEIDLYDKTKGYTRCIHLNAIAKDPEKAKFLGKFTEFNSKNFNEVIKLYKENGFIVNYNHPYWSAAEAADILELEGITAIEVYNHGTQIYNGKGISASQYDLYIKNGKKAFCIATDDNHNFDRKDSTKYASDSLGGFTMFKAPSLSYNNIINALENGNFYCSNGPLIYDLYIEDGKICIHCSPVSLIVQRNERIEGGSISSNNDSLTYAEFELRDNQPFTRIELIDKHGKMAFTNPIYL